MPSATYIARVNGLKISEHLGHGDRFFDDLLVTNDQDVAKRILKPHVQLTIGKLETEWLAEAETVIYGDLAWPLGGDREARLRLLNTQLLRTRLLLQALWLVRDHGANTEQAFLITPSAVRLGDDISSNSLSQYFTLCDGTRDSVTVFTREELRRARALLALLKADFASDAKMHHEEANTARFTRALFFVEAARTTHDLSVKIANYCTSFEALLALETGELTHRLGERLARFLGTDLASRKEIYASVKKAYEIRSRTVHGDRPDIRHEKLVPIARSCDDLLRSTMVKIADSKELHPLFMTSQKSPREFSQFLLDLILA